MSRTSFWTAAPGGLLVTLAFASSCFNPSFESGRSPCGAGGECPSGLTCDPSSRLCFRPGEVPDASIDVFQADATPRGDVTVIVIDQTGIAAGRPVLFNEPDGTSAVVNTDGDGRVVHDIAEGTTITSFIRPNEGSGAFLITYLGVTPGETVRMTVFQTTPPTPPNATVNFPGAFTRPSDGAAATGFNADFACNFSSTGTSPPPPLTGIAIRPDCLTPAKTTTVVAYATIDGLPEAFTFAAGIPVPTTDFAVTLGAWRTDFVVITPTVMNLPAESAHADAGPPKPELRVRFRAPGVIDRHTRSQSVLPFLVTPYTGEPPVKAARDVFDTMIVTAIFGRGGTLLNEASFARSFAPTVIAPLLDLSQAMPPISALAASYEADRVTINSTLAGPIPTEGDATALVFLTWPLDVDLGGWLLMGPAADLLGSYVTPTLPAALAEVLNAPGITTRAVGMAVVRSTCRSSQTMRAAGFEDDFDSFFGDPRVPDCVVDFVSYNFDI